MRSASPSSRNADRVRRSSRSTGIFFDEFCVESAWIRETATLQLPPLEGVQFLVLRGEYRPHPEAKGAETTLPGLVVQVNEISAGTISPRPPGIWELRLPYSANAHGGLTLRLTGVAVTNALAWLGRVTGLAKLQRFRAQNKNRQLRLRTLTTDTGEIVYDFSQRHAPFSAALIRRHAKLGLNIAGFLTADLGVAESARCMVRAADAAGLPCALVSLKLNCKNRLGDLTYSDRLQDTNPHPVNVIHLDPPAARDLDHHHGAGFRRGKYNVGYWAWELPEFPEAWLQYADYYEEVWAPSRFAADAIAEKVPVPVLTMPHAISFTRPEGDFRRKFGLPIDKFLFLFVYDLNSYSERKNPLAVLETFRRSALGGSGAALVIKVHNGAANPADFTRLRGATAALPGVILITSTLSRQEVYELESACDCFVSLHRSEGFGLALAESMYLGKPVISTDWSATAEFINEENGGPVRCSLVTLEHNHGPYAKGQIWAEPDIEHATWWMQRLCQDQALCRKLGTAARRTIEEKFSPAVIGGRYRRRLEAIASW